MSVEKILGRRTQEGQVEYQTLFSDGDKVWVPFENFVDPDQISSAFIRFASIEDWKTGFSGFTQKELKRMAKSNGISQSL